MELWYVITVATGIALGGVIVGSTVQRVCKFLYPYDFITILLAVFSLGDVTFNWTNINPIWYPPFWFGYFVGYLVVGRTPYTMVWETSLANKHLLMRPWVLYYLDGKMYKQDQSNIELLKRFLFRIHHEVVSNVPLAENFDSDVKYPIFPWMRKEVLCVEKVVPTYTLTPGRILKLKKHTSRMIVAYAGMTSKMQLAMDEAYLERMQEQVVALTDRVHDLQSQQGPALMEKALEIDRLAISVTPENRMYTLIEEMQKGKVNDEKGASAAE